MSAKLKKLFLWRRQVNALMGVSSHDFRDLRTEVTHVHELIRLVAKRHPDVKYKFSTGLEAFRDVVYGGKLGDPVELSVKFVPATVGDVPNISIKRKKGCSFWPTTLFGETNQIAKIYSR